MRVTPRMMSGSCRKRMQSVAELDSQTPPARIGIPSKNAMNAVVPTGPVALLYILLSVCGCDMLSTLLWYWYGTNGSFNVLVLFGSVGERGQ